MDRLEESPSVATSTTTLGNEFTRLFSGRRQARRLGWSIQLLLERDYGLARYTSDHVERYRGVSVQPSLPFHLPHQRQAESEAYQLPRAQLSGGQVPLGV